MKTYRNIASDVAEFAREWMAGKASHTADSKHIRTLMRLLHEYLAEATFENCQEHSPMPATRDGLVYCELCGKLLEEANVGNEYPY